jgi:hypothetical protein
MTSTLRRAVVAAALVGLAGRSALAQAEPEPGTVPASYTYVLDEYNLDVFGANDSSRIAAGLSFGTAYPDGWWWTAGPRIAFVRWNVDVPQQWGYGVGGTFGAGWHPDGTVSPFAGLALDRDFNVGGYFDWQTTVNAGARVKVTSDPREYFAMTFSVYHANVLGGSGPRRGETGIAVLYSAVLFARHR